MIGHESSDTPLLHPSVFKHLFLASVMKALIKSTATSTELPGSTWRGKTQQQRDRSYTCDADGTWQDRYVMQLFVWENGTECLIVFCFFHLWSQLFWVFSVAQTIHTVASNPRSQSVQRCNLVLSTEVRSPWTIHFRQSKGLCFMKHSAHCSGKPQTKSPFKASTSPRLQGFSDTNPPRILPTFHPAHVKTKWR